MILKTRKHEYVEILLERFREMANELNELEELFRSQLSPLKARKEELRRVLQQLQEASEDDWESLKKPANDVLADLQGELRATRTKIRFRQSRPGSQGP